LKNLFIGRAKFNVFTVRAEELIEDRPELAAAVDRCSRRPWVSSSRSAISIAVMKLLTPRDVNENVLTLPQSR
jgi:hypothetical protein